MLDLAQPAFLLLLPLFWIVQKFFPKKNKHDEMMLRVPFLARIQLLSHNFSSSISGASSVRKLLSIFAWCLLVLAAANPQWLGQPLPVQQEGRNIMLAIDLSPSMQMPDLQQNNHSVNRLQTVKSVASDFIEKRNGDKLGLILFGSKAYLQTPLTFDHKTVHYMLEDATIGLAGDRTAIGDAIGLAVKKFQTENIKSRILVLFTDGANNSGVIDPNAAAELAKDNKVKIYTIGIGATEMIINGIFGHQLINPSADLDESLLKKIASLTQGQYFRARDKAGLIKILEAINQLEPISAENKTIRATTFLFYWPLSLALICFLCVIFPNFNVRPHR